MPDSPNPSLPAQQISRFATDFVALLVVEEMERGLEAAVGPDFEEFGEREVETLRREEPRKRR